MKTRISTCCFVLMLLVISVSSNGAEIDVLPRMGEVACACLEILNGNACEEGMPISVSNKRAHRLFKEGWRLSNESRFDEAIEKFQEARRIADSILLDNTLGWTYYEAGRYKEAEKVFEAAINRYKDNAPEDVRKSLGEAYYLYAECYFSYSLSAYEEKDYEKALKACNKGLGYVDGEEVRDAFRMLYIMIEDMRFISEMKNKFSARENYLDEEKKELERMKAE